MRQSKILHKIRNGQRARVALLGHYVPAFVAFAARAGYDGIWLDLEHRAFDPREVQAILAFFHLYDIDCLLRPATREKAQLYRYLEDGATGLMVPHVNTAAEARDLVRSVKFPPIGDRGLNATSLDVDFGMALDGYTEAANRETFLIVQIETPQSVSEAEAIAAVEGVDGLFVGPADLTLRLPFLPAEVRYPYSEALEVVAAACARYGKFWSAMPTGFDSLQDLHARGAHMLVWGNDIAITRAGLTSASKDLDGLIGG